MVAVLGPNEALPYYIHTYIGLLRDIFPSGFPAKTVHEFILSPMRATCPEHLILLELIILIIFGEGYK
jgi:hypothetical protein